MEVVGCWTGNEEYTDVCSVQVVTLNGDQLVITASKTSTCATMKQFLYKEIGIAISEQRLLVDDKLLSDECLLSSIEAPILVLRRALIFEDDGDDVQAVAAYANDIYKLLYDQDSLSPAAPTNMNTTTPRTRGILVDWLLDVHRVYRLSPATLYITVQLLDRYLSITVVQQRHLQLIGCVCLLIASKLEDGPHPTIQDLVHISDGACTVAQVRDAETHVLAALSFKLKFPLVLDFIERFYRLDGRGDEEHRELTFYLVDISLKEFQTGRHSSAHLAAAAHLAASTMLQRQPRWSEDMEFEVTYAELVREELEQTAQDLMQLWRVTRSGAAYNKYRRPEHGCIALRHFDF